MTVRHSQRPISARGQTVLALLLLRNNRVGTCFCFGIRGGQRTKPGSHGSQIRRPRPVLFQYFPPLFNFFLSRFLSQSSLSALHTLHSFLSFYSVFFVVTDRTVESVDTNTILFSTFPGPKHEDFGFFQCDTQNNSTKQWVVQSIRRCMQRSSSFALRRTTRHVTLYLGNTATQHQY